MMCDVKNCKCKDITLVYYGYEICTKCHERHCDDNNNFDLKKHFNLKGDR